MSDKPTPFDALAEAAARYGDLSLENYTQVRSLAEQLAGGFCRYLRGGSCDRCCHLVPAVGEWAPADFASGAFSVSGAGFLPLQPISFGLAVRVSRTGDWMRLGLTAARSGAVIDIHVSDGDSFAFRLPIGDTQMHSFFDHLHAHLVAWFEDQSHHYEHGAYGGGSSMGFDFKRVAETGDAAATPP